MSAKDQKNISVEEVESDEDMPGLEEAPKTTDTPTTGGKQNRAEKKARRAIGKLNMKPVPGITRVTVKKAKNILFVIGQPEVFQVCVCMCVHRPRMSVHRPSHLLCASFFIDLTYTYSYTYSLLYDG
jgi:hypothetical protein